MPCHAIIEIPVSTSVTDSALAYEARVDENIKCQEKKTQTNPNPQHFNTLDWPLNSFILVNTNTFFCGM